MSDSISVPSTPLGQETSPFAPVRLPICQRGLLLAVGVFLLVLLVTAGRLTPSPQGNGTHQQLGLPPCTLIQWLGIRCPSCGMTTSWSYMMHGQPWQSCGANSGGALLAVVALIVSPWMITSALWGRHLLSPPGPQWIAGGSIVIGLITLVDWGLRLGR